MFRAMGVLVAAMVLLAGCDSAEDREAAAHAKRVKAAMERNKADAEHDLKLLRSMAAQNQ